MKPNPSFVIAGLPATLTALAVALIPASAPASVPEIAREAFANMPKVTGKWAFTRTREANDGTRVERFDPSAEPNWRLISVDGREPTSEERQDYAEEIEKRLARTEGRPGDNDFDQLAGVEGWEVIDETSERVTFRFRPAPGATDREAMAKHLDGEMTILKSVPYVESFRLYNREPFRAKLVAKIEHFSTHIRMTRLDERAYMPGRVTTEVKGSAFGLKDIDRDMEMTYSDFRYVGGDGVAGRSASASD